MEKVIVKKALDALKKQAIKDQELNELKGGLGISPVYPFDPPIVVGLIIDPTGGPWTGPFHF